MKLIYSGQNISDSSARSDIEPTELHFELGRLDRLSKETVDIVTQNQKM